MTLRKKLLSLLLAGALTLSLAACNNTSANPEVSPTPSPSTSPSEAPAPVTTPESALPDDFVVDTSAEDICLATTGIPGNTVLFTVDGADVTAYSYVYHLANVISNLEQNIYQSYGFVLDWTTDEALVSSVMESARHTAALYALGPVKAKELNCDLTDAQRSELDATIALTVQYMGGEEIFKDELRKSALDYDTFYNINASPYYFSQLQNTLFADRPTDEDVASYIEKNDLLRAKHILLMTVDSTTREPLDEATVAQKKSAAEDILNQLQNSTDLLADFDKLMKEYSEDGGLITNPDGYVFTSGQMVQEFESGTRALEFNQISGIIESTYGYHIILRLDPDTDAVRSDCLDSLFNDQMTVWMKEAEIITAPEYASFDLPYFYAAFNAYYEAFAAENASNTEVESPVDPNT